MSNHNLQNWGDNMKKVYNLIKENCGDGFTAKEGKKSNIAELKYIICRDCVNREVNCKGEHTGKCLAFCSGLGCVIDTSFIENNRCQAHLTEKGLAILKKSIRR